MCITYRIANLSDIDSITILFDEYRQFYNMKSNLIACKKFLSDRINNGQSHIIVASCNDVIIGFCQIYRSFSSISMSEIFIFNDFFVKSNMRSKGVGSGIIDFAKKFALSENINTIVLETGIDNVFAQSLYENKGFQKSKGFLSYYYKN